MYETILLPTDGSEGTAAAAEHAATVASAFDAMVHVVSVADERNRFESPSAGLAGDAWAEREHERAEAAVRETAAGLPDDVRTETAVIEGIPHEAIVAHAGDAGADVVVMGTHGRTGMDHYLVGSVAEKVVRTSPIPVLTVGIED
ncbi:MULTISPECIES: universal stress protein [unclassified Halobacterium]|uniref:universal stress protein n=1 Tax=unclassified Halobacterium TaxID=2668073 RepID=UPI0019624C50|nr:MULTISPECIES: universal stress protein [unclassified Halobacterium]QRY22543.1 universal stress protein [Halobacterium sp. GSL-19]QRY24608.1 universal stress protein [Halobacterium sp. BOL4-2]